MALEDDIKSYEEKFERGWYTTVEQYEEQVDIAYSHNNPRCYMGPWNYPYLPREEYDWLKKNHPGYERAYTPRPTPEEREKQKREDKRMGLLLLVEVVGVAAAIGGCILLNEMFK